MATFDDIDGAIGYVLQTLGDFADDFDAEAIAKEATRWSDGRLVLAVDGIAYWQIVARNKRR